MPDENSNNGGESGAFGVNYNEAKAAASRIHRKSDGTTVVMVTFRAREDLLNTVDDFAIRMSKPGSRVTRTDLLNEGLQMVVNKIVNGA